MIGSSRLLSVIVMSGALVMTLAAGCSVAPSGTRQEHIHQQGHGVMPFDLSKTTHIFQMTEEGGIQQVVAKDPKDLDQIRLIQQHLRNETARFQLGDFSDPATLHGEDMPGLKELQEGALRIAITYANLPTGAKITFATQDLHLVTAVHRWFGAQLSEHGADANYR